MPSSSLKGYHAVLHVLEPPRTYGSLFGKKEEEKEAFSHFSFLFFN
jgi:hypothetical protein